MVKFIAEISSNHNSNLERCFELIDLAAKIRCDAVKFQLFKIEKLFTREILKRKPDIRKRAKWELPLKFIPILYKRSKKLGLEFGCSPFYTEAVEELKPYVDFLKISSYDLLRLDLIKACALTGLSVILSTGMANLKEINTAVSVLRSSGSENISLLHCISSYPVLAKDCNLSIIGTLKKEFKCKVGWSDHSVSDAVIYRAVYRWNAEIIEFHFDLDSKGREYNIGHCWLPGQIAPLIKKIKECEKMDGDGVKKLNKNELKEKNWRADPRDGLRPLLDVRKKFK